MIQLPTLVEEPQVAPRAGEAEEMQIVADGQHPVRSIGDAVATARPSSRDGVILCITDPSSSVKDASVVAPWVSALFSDKSAKSLRCVVYSYVSLNHAVRRWTFTSNRASRTSQAEELCRGAMDAIERRTAGPEGAASALQPTRHVDATSGSLKESLMNVKLSHNVQFSLMGACGASVKGWTAWANRSSLENAVASYLEGQSAPLILCKKPLQEPFATEVVSRTTPLVAMACINPKTFMSTLPPSVESLIPILREGDSLFLFSMIETGSAAESMYTPDVQWHERVTDSIKNCEEHLKATAERIGKMLPEVKVAALRTRTEFVAGLNESIKEHGVHLLSMGRGSKEKVLGKAAHGMTYAVQRETYERVLVNVDVSAVMIC